jgi:hypothetical protein
MKFTWFIALALCGIAGGLARHFGGFGALTAVVIAEIGMIICYL